MTSHPLLLLPLLILTACPPADPGDDTAPEGDTDADTDADTDPALDPDILGSWSRVYEEPPYSVTVTWTGDANGDCEVMIDEMTKKALPCTFTADGSTFAIQDPECRDTVGSYSYVIAGQVVTFTTLDEACADRGGIIQGDWTRVE